MPAKKNLYRLKASEIGFGYAFLLPAAAFLFFFIFLSILYSVYMSFYDWTLFDLGETKTFAGVSHYLRLFSDEVFRTSLFNTLCIVIVCLLAEIALGLLIALTLWSLNKKLRVVQSVILLPMITSPVIVGLVWRYIYDPQFGILNYVLRNTIGISNLAWLGDAALALPSVMLVDIWQMTPFVVLTLFTAMTGISDDWIEAARVDGATFWQIARRVILPSITPMIAFTMLMRTMDLLKIFDTVYVLTKGGPGYSTETLALYTYKTGFSFYNMGYSMALSIFTLLFILLLSATYLRRDGKQEGGAR